MHIENFVCDATYPRARLRSTRKPDDRLQLSGVCLSRSALSTSLPSSSTRHNVVVGHGNGLPKELYYPYLEKVLESDKVRAIYVADLANQGQSASLNRDKLGDDFDWSDVGHDLLKLVDTFDLCRDSRCILLAHSIGAMGALMAATLRPNAFCGVLAIDPMIRPAATAFKGFPIGSMTLKRRDRWPSRAAFIASARKSPFFNVWDERVLRQWEVVGARPVSPVAAATTGEEGEVTLTTPVTQEAITFMGLVPAGIRSENHVDMARLVYEQLPNHTCPIGLLFGAKTMNITKQYREDYVARAKSRGNRVLHGSLNTGHLVPMEDVEGTAAFAMRFIEEFAAPWWQEQLAGLEADPVDPAKARRLIDEAERRFGDAKL